MRTRNRGRPTAFVSSLGLCGRKSARQTKKPNPQAPTTRKSANVDLNPSATTTSAVKTSITPIIGSRVRKNHSVVSIFPKCLAGSSGSKVKLESGPSTSHVLTQKQRASNFTRQGTSKTSSIHARESPSASEPQIVTSCTEVARSKRSTTTSVLKVEESDEVKNPARPSSRLRAGSSKSKSKRTTSSSSTPTKSDGSVREFKEKVDVVSNEPLHTILPSSQTRLKRTRSSSGSELCQSVCTLSTISKVADPCSSKPSHSLDLDPRSSLLQTNLEFQLLADMKIGGANDVLEEILQEINSDGHIPRALKSGSPQIGKIAESQEPEPRDFHFDNPIVGKLFNSIWSAPESVLVLEMKDLYLAVNGIFRPGVCEIWRRRREYQNRQLNRSTMGRLRPNPRPRRYSDMIIAPRPKRAVNGHQLMDDAIKLRRSSRSMVLAVARLSAAKKLIQARSRCDGSKFGASKTNRIRLVKNVGSSSSSQSQFLRSRNSSRSQTQLFLRSRSRRRPDISHHIDWKFCYSPTEKDRATLINQDELVPKRRRKATNSIADSGCMLTDQVMSTMEKHLSTSESELKLEIPETSSEKTCLDTELIGISEKIDQEGSTKKINSDLLSFKRENRNRRKRALTVQRKRPVDKLALRVVPDIWKTEYVPSCRPDDDVSSNSSASLSGLTDAYGRTVRNIRWGLEKPAPSPRIKRQLQSDNRLSKASKIVKSTRNSIKHRGRRSSNFTRPLDSSAAFTPPINNPRQSVTPRSDKMTELTLVDRLVLGLSCYVSEFEKEIHIKHLHSDELSILTQRIDKTGFAIKSLSLRKNAHGDAEYNLVLTFSPLVDSIPRRSRISTSNRLKSGASRKPAEWSVSHEPHKYHSSTKEKRTLMKKGHRIPRHHSPNNHSNASASRSSSLRATRSDDEGIDKCEKSKIITDGHSSTAGLLLSGLRSTYKATPTGRKQGQSQTAKPHQNLARTQSSTRSHPSERRDFSDGPLIGTKSDFDHYMQHSEHMRLPSMTHQSDTVALVNGMTKRASKSSLSTTYTPSVHRRPSPRKLVRKVYTGTATVPKILNRKRPSTKPASLISGSIPVSITATCSSSVVPSVFNQKGSLATSSFASTANTSVVPTTPTMVYDEPMRPLPPYSQPISAHFSLPYRQYPINTLTPVTMIPSAMHTTITHQDETYEKIGLSLDNGATCNPKSYPLDTVIKTTSSLNITGSTNILPSTILSTGDSAEFLDTRPIAAQAAVASHSPRFTATRPVATQLLTKKIVPTSGELSTPEQSSSLMSVSTRDQLQEPIHTSELMGDVDTNELDESHTPATSMSASQLLKLKRLHDDPSGSMNTSDADAGHQPITSSRVQSPNRSNQSSASTNSQSQPIYTETAARPRSHPYVQHSPQSRSESDQQSAVLSKPSGPARFGSGHLSTTTALNLPPNQYDASDSSVFVCEEGGDFELKPLGQAFDPSYYQSYRARLDETRFRMNLPFANILNSPRSTWSAMRPPFPVNPVQTAGIPMTPSGLTVVRTLAATKHTTTQFESQMANQVATNVIVPQPCQSQIRQNFKDMPPVLSALPTVIPLTTNSSVSLSIPSATISHPPLSNKRTVVHKYHSFRKILPKSPEHPGPILPLNTTAYINVPTFDSSSSELTQLPIINHLSRTHSQPSLSVDVQQDSSPFIVDYTSSSDRSMDRSAISNLPTSQLLKSILESGDSSNTVTSSASPLTLTTATTTMNMIPPTVSQHYPISSVSTTWNQPTHQSRGTWQLSRRAGVGSTNRSATNRPSTTAANDSGEHKDVRPFSVPRLVPGSTSRLQQLQQHYQRQQHHELQPPRS